MENYLIQGQFDVRQIVASLQAIAQQAKTSGQDIKTFLKNNTEAKQFLTDLKTIKSEFGNLQSQLKTAGVTQKEFDGALKQTSSSGYGARLAISQLGFAMGDFGMIAVNARMALMGIGNNMPFIIQGFAQLKQEAALAGRTVKQEFMTSLRGPNGLILGVNAALFAMQTIPAIFEAINKKAKEAADEGLSRFEKQMKNIGVFNIGQTRAEVMGNIAVFEAQLEYARQFKDFQTAQEVGMRLEAERKKLDLIKEKEIEISEQKSKRIGLLKVEIESIEGQINSIGNVAGAEKQITELVDKKALKQKELNTLLETTEEREKRVREELQKQTGELEKQAEIIATRQMRQTMSEFGTFPDLPILDDVEVNDPFGYYTSKLGRQAGRYSDDPFAGYADKAQNAIDRQTQATKALDDAWRHAGSTMISAMTRSIRLFKEGNNELANMLNMLFQVLLNIGINYGLSSIGIPTGIFPAIAGAGGGGAGGVNPSRIPSDRLGGGVPQNLNLSISGDLVGDGYSLHAVLKRIDKLERRYK